MSRGLKLAVAAGLIVLLWLSLRFVLLLFAAILLAILLRMLATTLCRVSGMNEKRALALIVVGGLAIIVVAGWVSAPQLARQSEQLTQAIPRAVSDLAGRLEQHVWGRWLLEQFSSPTTEARVADQAGTTVRRLFDGLVAAAVIIFGGIYLAAEPARYVRGALHLVPPSERRRAAETLYAIGHVLRWWLLGQVVAMAVVGLAMGLGLWLIGVQQAFALGLLSGLLEFVPIVGPVLALGPALVVALASSTEQALYVLVLYGIVQTGEGYVLTPLVQRTAVHLLPVVTIAAQLGLSWLAGPIGLLVAVPLTAVGMVAVQMLYIEDVLGERLALPFRAEARREVDRESTHTLRGLVEAPHAAAGLG